MIKKLFINNLKSKLFFKNSLAKILRLVYNPYKLNIPSGFCPVQTDGFLKSGEWYYFRSRWNRWYVAVAKSEKHWEDGDLIFFYEDFFKDEFVGGWISPIYAYILINKGIRNYYKQKNKKH